MTRNIWRAAVIMMLVLGLGMTAQAEDTKIGFVDLDQAIGATAEGKAARDELEAPSNRIVLGTGEKGRQRECLCFQETTRRETR